MEEEAVVNEIKDEDVVSEEYTVEYDISEVGNVLSELSNIQNTMNNLQKQFDYINRAIQNSRLILHKLDKDEDLP